MRLVTIPADTTVTLDDGRTGPLMFVENLIERTWTRDSKFGASLDALYVALDIRARFKGKKAGDVVELDEAPWAQLLAVALTPSVPYQPELMLPAVYMIEALRDAPKKSDSPTPSA